MSTDAVMGRWDAVGREHGSLGEGTSMARASMKVDYSRVGLLLNLFHASIRGRFCLMLLNWVVEAASISP